MPFEPTATRLWKRLPADERLLAAQTLVAEQAVETLGPAIFAIAQARRMRPQSARVMPQDQQAKALAGIVSPGEAVASSLLVALHVGHRRPLLGAFLDACQIPHEDGILTEAADGVTLTTEVASAAVQKLEGQFPREQIDVYLNTLWLQDPERWGTLASVG
jgi:hypothetical protein